VIKDKLRITTGHEARTLPIAFYYFKSAFASDYGAMFATIVLVSLPSIIDYTIFQKQVVTGLAAGSVKVNKEKYKQNDKQGTDKKGN
jgi:raffinose/stachyose/melibiose transport system permease protein